MFESIIKKVNNFDFSNIKLAIVYGGEFEESDISRMSFFSVAKNLKEVDFAKIDAIEYTENIVNDLQKSNPNIVLNMMHGEFGEDGGLPTICEMLNIKYTHSGRLASGLGMRKDLCKLLFKANNIDVAKSITLTRSELNESNILDFLTKNNIEKSIVKPYDGGSSIGISICTTDNIDLSESLKSRSNGFLVEEFIDGDEFFVPVLLDRAIDVIQVSTAEGFYDYHNKYNAESKSRHIFPAKIPADVLEKMKNFAEIAHKVIDCKTLSRSDFIYSESTNRFVMSEINTHPGFTPKSLFPEVCNHYGVDFETLIKIIIYDGYFG